MIVFTRAAIVNILSKELNPRGRIPQDLLPETFSGEDMDSSLVKGSGMCTDQGDQLSRGAVDPSCAGLTSTGIPPDG